MPIANSPSDNWARPPRALIVEDDEAICELLTARLESVGYRVSTAADGAEALRMARTITPPDIIVLDLAMPNLDGFGFLARRRNNLDICDLPVVVMSAAQRASDVTRAINMGAVDYLTKPVDFSKLLRRMATHLPPGVRRSEVGLRRNWV